MAKRKPLSKVLAVIIIALVFIVFGGLLNPTLEQWVGDIGAVIADVAVIYFATYFIWPLTRQSNKRR